MLGFVKSNPDPGRSNEEIINHLNSKTQSIENVNYKPMTIGLNNQGFSGKVNPMQKITLEDKLWNSNYNGPITPSSLLGNNFNNINFKQKANTKLKGVNRSRINNRNELFKKSESFFNKKN